MFKDCVFVSLLGIAHFQATRILPSENTTIEGKNLLIKVYFRYKIKIWTMTILYTYVWN